MSEFSKQTRTEDAASPKGDADLYFRIQGLPIAKPRQSRRDSFQPSSAVQRYRAWADAVRLAARPMALSSPIPAPWRYTGAVAMAAIFFLPIPKSWPRKRKLMALDVDRPIPHIVKPDLSNLIKALEDPLNGLVWADDAQVIEYRTPCKKCYGASESAGAHCWIWFLEEQS